MLAGLGRATCIRCALSLAYQQVPRRFFHASAPLLSSGKKRDPFEVLGVVRGATRKAIKKAYLEKAKQHHPDQNQGTSTIEFMEIQEAYEAIQGIVTSSSSSSSTSTSTSTTTATYEDNRPRTRGHGYARNEQDVYERMRRNDPDQDEEPQVFHDTVKVGHIPLVFVAEWDAANSILALRTHSFKSRAHPNDPYLKNEESVFATVRHSKLDNGAPCIDLLWEGGNVIAKSFSHTDAKFHNPRTNSHVPQQTKNDNSTKETSMNAQDSGVKMTMEGGKMVVEDAEGTLMGYIIPDHSWFRKSLHIEDPAGIKVGKATWSKFSPTLIQCEDEYGKKVATALLQETKWVVHLSPLASVSQHDRISTLEGTSGTVNIAAADSIYILSMSPYFLSKPGLQEIWDGFIPSIASKILLQT